MNTTDQLTQEQLDELLEASTRPEQSLVGSTWRKVAENGGPIPIGTQAVVTDGTGRCDDSGVSGYLTSIYMKDSEGMYRVLVAPGNGWERVE